jgi:pantoate--beta-alanine ligase
LGKYPRPLERDLEMLRAQNVTLVFTPTPEEMYPRGFQTYVTVEQVSQVLEGAARPGHLRGVATVVCKLFNIFQPDRAYFGQKDAQQVAVIRRMTRDLDLPVGIVVCPTVREPDGLALSSRNVYLNSTERQAATALYRALVSAQEAWTRGEREGGRLRAVMMKVLEAEPLARVDYVSAADPETLIEFESATDRVLLSLAVRIGTTRLIDNFLLEE